MSFGQIERSIFKEVLENDEKYKDLKDNVSQLVKIVKLRTKREYNRLQKQKSEQREFYEAFSKENGFDYNYQSGDLLGRRQSTHASISKGRNHKRCGSLIEFSRMMPRKPIKNPLDVHEDRFKSKNNLYEKLSGHHSCMSINFEKMTNRNSSVRPRIVDPE